MRAGAPPRPAPAALANPAAAACPRPPPCGAWKGPAGTDLTEVKLTFSDLHESWSAAASRTRSVGEPGSGSLSAPSSLRRLEGSGWYRFDRGEADVWKTQRFQIFAGSLGEGARHERAECQCNQGVGLTDDAVAAGHRSEGRRVGKGG